MLRPLLCCTRRSSFASLWSAAQRLSSTLSSCLLLPASSACPGSSAADRQPLGNPPGSEQRRAHRRVPVHGMPHQPEEREARAQPGQCLPLQKGWFHPPQVQRAGLRRGGQEAGTGQPVLFHGARPPAAPASASEEMPTLYCSFPMPTALLVALRSSVWSSPLLCRRSSPIARRRQRLRWKQPSRRRRKLLPPRIRTADSWKRGPALRGTARGGLLSVDP